MTIPENVCTPCPYYEIDTDECMVEEFETKIPKDANCYDEEKEKQFNETR